jgi:hypothetical protein
LGAKLTNVIRRKPASFEEYWLASKAWQGRGLTLASARALTNAGFLSAEDLQKADTTELAMIPRIGAKSLALLCELKGEKLPDVEMLSRKSKRVHILLGPTTGGPAARSGTVSQPVLPHRDREAGRSR